LLRFSLKEALYKALHPFVCRYIGFLEAEVQPVADGTAKVALLSSYFDGEFERVEAHWRRVLPGYFLTSVRVKLNKSAVDKDEECKLQLPSRQEI
jgi:enterobactin synthetase component D